MAEQTGIKTVYEIRIEQGQALKEFERLNKSLLEVRAKKVELNKENKAAIAQEILLEKAIALEGVATKEQAAQLVKLKAERTLTNKAISEATIVERALASQTRELGNDLGGLTAAGTRFRDKMAGAFATAIEGTTAFQQLANQSQQLESTLKGIDTAIERNAIQLQTLNNELKEGAITEEQYTEQTKKLNSELEASKAASTLLTDELGKVTQRSDELDKKLEALNAEFNAGKINQEQYKQGLVGIETETRKAGEATSTLTSRFDAFTSNQGQQLKSTLSGLALQYVGIGAAIYGASRLLGDAARISEEFEASQSNLAAILGKSKGEIVELTDDAKKYGATTAFTASQVTELQTELGKLGFGMQQIKAATPAVLSLASATGTDLANAATIAAQTLNAFGLAAEDTPRIVDVIAKSANLSAFDIDTFSEAMSNAAPAAKAVGVEVEDAAALLSLLVDAGVPASKAGTDLRNIFIELEAKGMTMDEAFGNIRNSTDKLTVATELFGQRSGTSGTIIADNIGKLEGLEEAYRGAGGSAAEMAKTQLDNLKGDKLILTSAWEGFVLSIEDGTGPISASLRTITQGFTDILGYITELNKKGDILGESTGTGKGSGVRFDNNVEVYRDAVNKYLKANDQLAQSTNTDKLLSESQDKLRVILNSRGKTLEGALQFQETLRKKIEDLPDGSRERALSLVQLEQVQVRITELRKADVKAIEDQSKADVLASLAKEESLDKEGASIGDLKDKLSDLKKQRSDLAETDGDELDSINKQITETTNLIASLEGRKVATEKLGEAEKARAELSKSLTSESGAADIAKLPEQQQEVAQATAKRDERVEVAQGDTALLLQIEEAYQREVLAIRNNYGAQQTAAFDAQESELLTRQVEGYRQELDLLIKSQQDALAAAPVGNRNEMLEQQAQERLVIITNIQTNERTLLLQQFDTERADAEAAGTDLIALKKQQGEELVALEVQFALDRAEAQGIDKDALATIQQQYKLEQIQGVVDFNTQKALVQAEFDAGVIKSKEELNAKLDQLDKEAQENTLAATSSLFSSLQAISDAGFDKRISEQSDKLTELKSKLASANTDQEKEEIRSQISRVEAEKTALEKRKKSNQTFAIAAALINTYLAATNALSTVVPTVPAGVIAAAAVVAGGLLQVSKIAGFAEGGEVKSGDVTSSWGPSVTRPNGDNVLVRAGRGFVTLKTGEKVLNADQQRELEQRTHPSIWGDIGLPGHTRRSMNQFRVAYMGHGYATGGTVGQIAPRPSPSTVVQNQFISSMESFANRPVTVGVDEIARVQGRVTVIEAAGSL